MKKSILNLLLLVFVVTPIGGMQVGCQAVCSVVDKSDMIIEAAKLVEQTVTNKPFNLTTIVANLVGAACKTESTPQTDTGYQVEYRNNSGSSWESAVFKANNGTTTKIIYGVTPAIEAGKTSGRKDDFEFLNPGEYRFIGTADGTNKVSERNENNNTTNTDGKKNGRTEFESSVAVVVVVKGENLSKDDKKGGRTENGEVIVKYLGGEVLY